jgi:intracellular septation protein
VLGSAYPGLSERGWRLLSRNWACYFLLMAVANEAVRRLVSTDMWVAYKLWVVFPLTVVFALANVPMLMRHGMAAEAAKDEIAQIPPEG